MIMIIDASSIIAFYSEDELNEPDLLHTLLQNNRRLIIPIAVYEEIRKGGKQTFSVLSKAIENNKIKVCSDITPEETELFGKRHPRLGDGELQVLLLGLRHKAKGTAYCCVIDEGAARSIAKRNGLAVKGTKGLIFLLNQIGVIDKSKMENLLYILEHCNFRL
jgi:predicted nucleic acid-binding protein